MTAKKTTPPTKLAPLPIRFAKLHGKLIIAAVVGIAFGMLAPFEWRPATRLLIAWNVAVTLYLGLVYIAMARGDIEHIRRRAAEQDEGALVVLLLTIAATFASLVAIVFELGAFKQSPHGQAIVPLLHAMLTILLSWAFVHTIFALHYAHEYYGERRDGIIGGLTFPVDKEVASSNEEPDYWDFLYFSLVIGMTSQTSDVAVTSKGIRRIVAIHGVLSFFFNLTVLALTVNMASNFI